MLTTRVLRGRAPFEELPAAWRELVEVSPGATPFQTLEWQTAWWRHFGRGKRPLTVAVYEGEDLVGLMPFSLSRGPWRALRPSGVGPSDYLHPLAREGYESPVAERIGQAIQEIGGVDLIDLQQVRETRAFARFAPQEHLIPQATCLVLDLPETYDAYLSMLGKSLRYDVRRLDKSLFKGGRASLQAVGPAEIGAGMNVLLDQHRRRWRRRGLPGAFVGGAARFHQDWAHQAVRNGWLWLSVLRLDGRPIGAIYAMALGRTCYYYQAGFDPAHGSISPGTLLVAETIRRAIDEGKTEFDFMRGDEPYKRRWKPQHVLQNVRMVTPLNPALGRAGLRWNMAGSRMERRVRARLEGRGLI
jgi:CelD/BcsL family acetyltransferase involved in cellulose biosynthesis